MDTTPKNVEIAIVDSSRTRAHELIKIQQQNGEFGRSRFRNFFKRKGVDTDTHLLTSGQLLLFYIVLQVPLYELNWYVKVSRSHGGMNAFVSYTLVTLVAHFPLFLLYTTMAYYSKKGFLTFWDCLPICKGLSYSCLAITIMLEINNVHSAGMSILYIYESFDGIPWWNCDFEDADENCIPQYPKFEVPLNNCHFASNQYNKYNKRNLYRDKVPEWNEIGSIKIDWAIAIWFCCFVVFISSILGFKKCASYLYRMLLIITLGFTTLLHFSSSLYSVLHRNRIFSIFKGHSQAFDPELWVQALLINIQSNSPGIIIYLSSVSPENMKSPVTIAFKVFSGKIILSTIFITWYAFTADQTMTIYNMRNGTCIAEVSMLQFTVFVDVLAELPLPFIWLNIHYVSIFIMHLSATIITVTASLNSLSEATPYVAKHRIRTSAVICLVLGCLNMITVTEGAEAYDTTIRRGLSFTFLIINVFSVSGIVFIYGVKTLKHDILFMYGNTLIPLFWFSITLLPIVLMLITVYIIRISIRNHEFVFKGVSIVVNVILCLPLVLVPIYQYTKKGIRKHSHSLFVPAKTWGVERKLRKAREAFNPDKEVEYNARKLKCDHYCLVHSTRYKREVFSQKMLFESLLTQMAESKKEEETTHDN